MTAVIDEQTVSTTTDKPAKSPLVALIVDYVSANPCVHASGPLVLQGHMRRDREVTIVLTQHYCRNGIIGKQRGIAFTEAAGQCLDFVTDDKGITRPVLKAQHQTAAGETSEGFTTAHAVAA